MIETDSLFKQFATSAARHAGSAIAGALVTIGAVQPGSQESTAAIVTGVIVWAGMQAWSWWQKKRAAAKLQEAADAPTGTPVVAK